MDSMSASTLTSVSACLEEQINHHEVSYWHLIKTN